MDETKINPSEQESENLDSQQSVHLEEEENEQEIAEDDSEKTDAPPIDDEQEDAAESSHDTPKYTTENNNEDLVTDSHTVTADTSNADNAETPEKNEEATAEGTLDDDAVYENAPEITAGKEKKKKKKAKTSVNSDDFEYDRVPELSFLSIKSESPFETAQKRQEKRIVRQKYAIIALVCISIALLSLALFIGNHYQKQHDATVDNSVSRIISLMNAAMSDDFDYNTKYYEIVAELDVIRTTVFYSGESESNKKILNSIYYISVRLPNQYKEYMADICEGFTDIKNGDTDNGMLVLQTVIDRADKLDIQ